jgi:hypothetical protein
MWCTGQQLPQELQQDSVDGVALAQHEPSGLHAIPKREAQPYSAAVTQAISVFKWRLKVGAHQGSTSRDASARSGSDATVSESSHTALDRENKASEAAAQLQALLGLHHLHNDSDDLSTDTVEVGTLNPSEFSAHEALIDDILQHGPPSLRKQLQTATGEPSLHLKPVAAVHNISTAEFMKR